MEKGVSWKRDRFDALMWLLAGTEVHARSGSEWKFIYLESCSVFCDIERFPLSLPESPFTGL